MGDDAHRFHSLECGLVGEASEPPDFVVFGQVPAEREADVARCACEKDLRPVEHLLAHPRFYLHQPGGRQIKDVIAIPVRVGRRTESPPRRSCRPSA